MDFTEAQRQAIDTDGVDLVVVAGAGSGKTRVLVERYIRLLERYEPDRLLAITFTDKAAREMRARVRDALETRARTASSAGRALWEQRRAEIEAARIGTIHSFCAALLRAHPAETGLDPGFVVLDEVQSALLLRESAGAALAEIAAVPWGTGAEDVRAALEEFGAGEAHDILIGLLQGGGTARAAVAGLPGDREALLARWRADLAAGRRAALDHLLADPGWRAAWATFRRIAPEAPAGDRLGDQFAALAASLHDLAAAGADFSGYDRLAALDGITLAGGAAKRWGGPERLREAKDCLRALREGYRGHAAQLEAVWDEPLERRAARAVLGIAALYRLAATRYAARKLDQDALDFDDLEVRATQLLVAHPALRERWARELRAILVDEFQDTNAEQRDLIYALAGYDEVTGRRGEDSGGMPTPGQGRLFVVADGKQSIYRFRGADVGVFGGVRARVRALGGVEIALDVSFRAHERLVALVNYTFERLSRRERPLLPYEMPYEALRRYRDPSPHPAAVEIHVVPGPRKDHPLLVTQEDVRRYQAHVLARRLRELRESGAPLVAEAGRWRAATWGDIALLFQAAASFEHYEEALRAERIPFLTTAGRGYYGRKEVRDLVNLLRFLHDPGDDFSLAGALRSPLFALDDATILRLRFANPRSLWAALLEVGDWGLEIGDWRTNLQSPISNLTFVRDILQRLLALRGRVPVVDLLRAILSETGYMVTVSGLRDGDRRRANVEKLLDAARRAGAAGLATFDAYLRDVLEVEAREGEAPLEGGDAVRLMTVHRSKGLEFPIVGLPDMAREAPARRTTWLARRDYGLALKLRDGAGWTQPAAYRVALAEEARQERAERERLAYVALTRARDYLILAGHEREVSGEDWLSWTLATLGWPWEAGGPPAGRQALAGGALEGLVWRYGPPEQPLPGAAEPATGWDLLAGGG